MRKTILAFAVAALTLAAVPASQAAPIAPLPAGVPPPAHASLVHGISLVAAVMATAIAGVDRTAVGTAASW